MFNEYMTKNKAYIIKYIGISTYLELWLLLVKIFILFLRGWVI